MTQPPKSLDGDLYDPQNIKAYLRSLTVLRIRQIWNFEAIYEHQVARFWRICSLCFSAITCPNDLSHLQALENRLQALPTETHLFITCKACQLKLASSPQLLNSLERYVPVHPLLAFLCLLTYIALATTDPKESSACPSFIPRFRMGGVFLRKQYCGLTNKAKALCFNCYWVLHLSNPTEICIPTIFF